MSHKIAFTRRAESDLRKIAIWLRKRSRRGAEFWRYALNDCLLEVVRDPYRYEQVTESSVLPTGIRQALFQTRKGNVYRVIFLVDEPTVTILRIRGPGQRNLRRRDLN